MKASWYHILPTVLLCTAAHGQSSPLSELPKTPIRPHTPQRDYNAATQETGTIIRKDIRWNSKIPLDKTYEQLTDEQKAELHAMYETLGEGDEPPFPENGIKPIFNAIKKAQRIRQARGELILAVTVGPDGKATLVEELGSVYDIQLTELAQQVLLLTKYKPGKCKGQPCTMKFKFVQQMKPG